MSISASVATLLQHLVTLPDICLVIGAHEAICELFVDPATMDFRVDGDFVTMENGPWHIHLDATKVHTHTFALEDLPTALRYARERIEDAIKVVVKTRGAVLNRVAAE